MIQNEQERIDRTAAGIGLSSAKELLFAVIFDPIEKVAVQPRGDVVRRCP